VRMDLGVERAHAGGPKRAVENQEIGTGEDEDGEEREARERRRATPRRGGDEAEEAELEGASRRGCCGGVGGVVEGPGSCGASAHEYEATHPRPFDGDKRQARGRGEVFIHFFL
jgi:hypothetical protein